MKQFSEMLRVQTDRETLFRATHFDAAIGRGNADKMREANPAFYVAEYSMLWALGDLDRSRLKTWCEKNGKDFEANFLHREDGTHAFHPWLQPAYWVANIGRFEYRQWLSELTAFYVIGAHYAPAPRRCWLKPSNGVLVDEAVYWPKFDVGLARISETVEYAERGAEGYRQDGIALLKNLQMSCGFDIIPNLSTTQYALENPEAIAACKAFEAQVAIQPMMPNSAYEDLERLIVSSPGKKKFLGIFLGDYEWAARVAAFYDDGTGDCFWHHRRSEQYELPVWMWGYNPLIESVL